MTRNVPASTSMDELPPSTRVLTGGRPELVAYQHQVVTSTVSRHGPAIEAVIEVACNHYRNKHKAYVTYLAGRSRKGTGEPGKQSRSHRWNEAYHGYVAAQEALAAALNVQYPHPTRPLPLVEADELVRHRVGPLCSGWTVDDDTTTLTHHPRQLCEVHNDQHERAS